MRARVEGSPVWIREQAEARRLKEWEESKHRSDRYWEKDVSSTSDKRTYAIYAPSVGRVKIGCANDVLSRGTDLQSASPVELVLIAQHPFNIERRMHGALKADRLHGEWFHYSRPVADLIRYRMSERAAHSFVNGEAREISEKAVWQDVSAAIPWARLSLQQSFRLRDALAHCGILVDPPRTP